MLSRLLITCTPTKKHMHFRKCLLQLGSDPLFSLRVSELEHKIYKDVWLQNVAIQRDESLSVSKKKIHKGEGSPEIKTKLAEG